MGSGISGHSGREVVLGVSGGSGSLPRRMAFSSGVGEALHSSPAGFKSETSTI